MLKQIFRVNRFAQFRLLSACHFVDFDSSVICHEFYALFRLISIARYIFKSPSIYLLRGTKYEFFR